MTTETLTNLFRIPEDIVALCDCENCPLKGSQKILGEGTSELSQYDLVFVGMAPEKTELELGRPFVGWAGQVLRQLLEKLKVTNFYITNTLLCQMPEEWKPSEERLAIQCCSKRLSAELKIVKPELVVALGNMPLEVLTGVDYKVTKVNSRIVAGLDYPVLPVIHPASLRRRPDEFYEVVDGLRSAPRYLSGTYQQCSKPNMLVANEDNLGEICRTIEQAGIVAVDLETTGRGFYPYGRDPDKIRCIVVSPDEKTTFIIPGVSSPYYEPHPDYSQDSRLREVLKKTKLVTHNGSFDVGFLMQAGYDVEIFFDTFLAHYMLDEREYSHGLKKLAHRYTGAPDWESDLKEYLPHKTSSYDLIPDDKLYEYAAWDGTQTYQLSEGVGLRKRVPKIYWDLILPCANMFTKIRHKGFPIDVEYLMNLDSDLETTYDEELEALEKLVGHTVNPLSPQEVNELLYDELKFPVTRFGRSSNKAALAALGGPICEGIQECRHLGKLKSTYVMGVANFIDNNFRIHPFTKMHGAVTGRISTEDPSVMNITKKGGVKKLYIADNGNLVLEIDGKQMEMHCYAVVADDKELKRLLIEGADVHKLVAQELARRRKLIWDSMTEDDQKALRQRCKSGVFGRMGGMQLQSYQFGYGLGELDAESLVSVIDSVVPTLKTYRSSIIKQVHNKERPGILESYFGRKR
ncbi:MAG: hypothetical protein KKC55_13800, partial [Gammaproteobacteria bacterium]|nr:hypothetical protein [Gammaproteobacteria bacterium]